MNFKEATKQEMKVFKISDYQNLYELTDSQMAERVDLSLNRYQEIMKDCGNITLEEVNKIARGLDINVSTLMDCLLENINPPIILSLNSLELDLPEKQSRKLAEDLAHSINERSIITEDGEYLIVNSNNRAYKLLKLEERQRMCKLLLKHGFVKSAMYLCGDDNILNIKSLSDLEFTDENYRNVFLYGKYKSTIPNITSVPRYFYNIVNDLSPNDQIIILNKALSILNSKLELSKEIDDEQLRFLKDNFEDIRKDIEKINEKISSIEIND